MPELNIVRGYEDGEALLEADLDNIKTAVTTLNNTTKYDGDNIQTDAITAAKIINGTVTAATLGAGSVTTNKVNDLAITTAKILDGEIETRVIADSAVTTAKLANSSITTAKFSTASRLGASKLASRVVLTGSNSSSTTDSTSSGEVTIVSATAVADMREVLIILQPYDSTPAYVEVLKDYGVEGGVAADLRFKINGSTIGSRNITIQQTGVYRHYYRLPISAFSILNNLSSNFKAVETGDVISVTLDFSIQGSATGSATVTACKLYVIEL